MIIRRKLSRFVPTIAFDGADSAVGIGSGAVQVVLMTSRPKAIAVDLDGTLLDSYKRISQANLDAIRRCQEAGILVLPATSRPVRSSRYLLADTPIVPGPGVFLGGSIALNLDGTKCVEKVIPREVTAVVIETIERYAPGAWVTIECDDEWFANRLPDIAEEPILTYGAPTILDLKGLAQQPASKIVTTDGAWFANRPYEGRSMREVYESLNQEFGDGLSYVLTVSGQWLEVLPENTAKERALEVLLGCNGIDIRDCVAFGDGSNDVTFLAGCGRSVAMGNAVPPCLEVATYITKTNDEDGFAWAVEDFLGI